MWFAADSDPAAALDALCAELRADHVPARTANVLYAVAGLLRATQAADTARAAELSMRALRALRDAQLLPDAATFGERDAGVAGAAVECLGHVAAANAHDSAALGHAAQQLMGTAARMSGLAALAAARALMQVYTALAAQPAQSAAGDDVVAEADDVRRSLERLNVLDMRADAGGAGLAMALAAMHRDWLTRALDPAQADANTTPRAATALRTVARTLAEAHARVQQSDVGAALPSLFYLSFVWPPRPIAQRHIELQPELLSVTPDRVWPSCMRLLRAARALGAGADTAGLVEIAAAVLTHHQLLTAGQTAAHARLVGELAGWVRGLTDDSRAADEQQALQAARVVALGIALGVPLHGVAETTVSNAYLPAAQRRSLSVLLSVGSVQHGSTAWLRLSEPVLHDALAALAACAGLADTEVGNVRAARVAGFVLSVLRAQSVRAEQLLAINEEKSGQLAAGDISVDLSEDVEPDMIEPASLVHLPAPTSWCRAVWESICDLSAALPDPAVERRLVRLLSALLIAERPFPAVDMQPVLRHIVDMHLQSNAGLDQRLPLLRLVIEVSDKLSQVLHSAAQFIDDASVQVVRRAVELARAGSVERVDAIYSDTLLSIALMCVGRHGLGRVLSLAGLSAAGEGREPAVPTDLVRIVGTTEFYARHRLTLALALPCNRRRSEAESDAARMFRVASRVAVSAPRAVALCTRLVELVFSADEVACLALQLRLLATAERHVANPGTVDSREVARESARAQISEMALSVSERSECVRVRRAALAVACGGANESRGHELLASDLRGLGDSDLCLVLQRQALVLELWIGTKADPGIAQVRGVAGGWLKQLFKEWTRRGSGALDSMAGSLRAVATALYSQRANDRVKCEWIVNALDLGILALSNGHESIVRTALTCWLLPLLTGYGALEPELLSALGGELVEYVEAEAAEAGQKRMRQYSALLRTRAVGLLDLTTDAKFQRALRRVLASLAMLGKLPAADLSRI
ncbi:hypothetical protein IWW55_003659 [Coemansia sp. RSA 2706]|nr:hypothetical protein IWW55_003659 [Coemansia sp. RSA 2706]